MANQSGEEHGSVTPYQLTACGVGAIIGVGVLAIPRFIVEVAGTAAPLATLLGTIPSVLAWLAYDKVGRQFPRMAPVEYANRLVGRPLGWLYSTFGILYVIGLTGLTVREFGEVVKVAILPNTPLEISQILMILAAAYFVRYDLQVFARVFEVFLPLMLAPLTLIGLLSLRNARAYYLFPIFGTSWSGLLRGSALAAIGYVAMMILPSLLPSVNRKEKARNAGLWSIGLSAAVYMLATCACLAVFGPEEIRHTIWPTFELVKVTTVPGFILERLESAFIGIWVAAVFTTLAATYYTILLASAMLLKLGDHKTLAIPLVPILYMVAMIPKSVHALYRAVILFGLVGVALVQGAPLLYLLVWAIRRKGAQASETKA